MAAFVVLAHDRTHTGVEAALSDGDRARLAALELDPSAADRFLSGRAALQAAAARLGERSIRIEALCPDCGRSHGRPAAVGASGVLHLALSHAAGRAFAIASRVPIGIDAEPLDAPAGRLDAIDDLAPGRGHPLHRWTAIEAVLKADGRGLRLPPGAVVLRAPVRGIATARLDGRDYRLRTSRAAGCVVTVAEAQPESDGSRV